MLKMDARGSTISTPRRPPGAPSGWPSSSTPTRCPSHGNIAPSSSARPTGDDAGGAMKGSGAMKPSSMFYVHEADVVQVHHFLEECSLCGKSLSGDIFMYRGDTPFCSEECRQQQIEVDRAKHRRKKRAAALALSARREHRHQQHHHHHHHHYHVHHQHQHQHQHQQPQPRKVGMDMRPWADAGFPRAPALRV